MKFTRLLPVVLALLAVGRTLGGATLPAAQLLPPDTLAFVSVPDWDKAMVHWRESAHGRLWQDPSLKAFKEKILQGWQDDWIVPLQRELGIKLADYYEIARGQATFAITQNGWGTQPEARPGLLLLLDAKDEKQQLLKTRLEELRKKWVDSGKPLKTHKIRDAEFTTLLLKGEDLLRLLEKIFPSGKAFQAPEDTGESPEPAARPVEITLGQAGSLLLVSNNLRDIERVLARQAGGLAPSVAEQGLNEGKQATLLRDALASAWVNFARVYELLSKPAETPRDPAFEGPFTLRSDKLFAASGLGAVKSLAAGLSGSAEGTFAEVFVNVPEARRQGVLRVLAVEPKESGPPGFVSFGTVKFRRWRVDGPKAWNTLEKMLTAVSPEVAGLLQMAIQAAGKDRDPNFDLKRSLIGNLGDDFIAIERSPRAPGPLGVSSPSSLLLVGSANPEQLVEGIRAASALMPLAGGDASVKEHEFLGRKIYSLNLAPLGGDGDEQPAAAVRRFSFAASGGYAALSGDIALLEEYLRSSEAVTRSLRETPGLAEAAQKVAGTSTGFFGYEDQAEQTRLWLESVKGQKEAVNRLLSLTPLPGSKLIFQDDGKGGAATVDASLLPPFETIAKYFHFVVYSLGASQEGLSWRFFAPTPPRMRQ